MDKWLEDRNRAIESGEFRTASMSGPYSIRNFLPKMKKRARPEYDELEFEADTLELLQERKRKMRRLRRYFRI